MLRSSSHFKSGNIQKQSKTTIQFQHAGISLNIFETELCFHIAGDVDQPEVVTQGKFIQFNHIQPTNLAELIMMIDHGS